MNTLGCCPTDVHKLVSMEICDIQDIEVLRKVKLDRLEEQRKHNEKKRNQRTEKSLEKNQQKMKEREHIRTQVDRMLLGVTPYSGGD